VDNKVPRCPQCDYQYTSWLGLSACIDGHTKGWAAAWSWRRTCFCGMYWNISGPHYATQEMVNHLQEVAAEDGLDAHLVLSELAR